LKLAVVRLGVGESPLHAHAPALSWHLLTKIILGVLASSTAAVAAAAVGAGNRHFFVDAAAATSNAIRHSSAPCCCTCTTVGLINSTTVGLIDSTTVGLIDSTTVGLIDSTTVGLIDSTTVGLIVAERAPSMHTFRLNIRLPLQLWFCGCQLWRPSKLLLWLWRLLYLQLLLL
jgi:hypothetical protein